MKTSTTVFFALTILTLTVAFCFGTMAAFTTIPEYYVISVGLLMLAMILACSACIADAA